MNESTMLSELQRQRVACEEVLKLVQTENETLSGEQSFSPISNGIKKDLLERLSDSLNSIRRQRIAWQQTGPSRVALHPQLDSELKSNLDLIMRIIVLGRENEQLLVRRGLLPPGRLPGKQPHFVSDVYRRAARA